MFDRLTDIRTFPVIGETEDYAMLYTPRLIGSRGGYANADPGPR
jgi:hypothetical protein